MEFQTDEALTAELSARRMTRRNELLTAIRAANSHDALLDLVAMQPDVPERLDVGEAWCRKWRALEAVEICKQVQRDGAKECDEDAEWLDA